MLPNQTAKVSAFSFTGCEVFFYYFTVRTDFLKLYSILYLAILKFQGISMNFPGLHKPGNLKFEIPGLPGDVGTLSYFHNAQNGKTNISII